MQKRSPTTQPPSSTAEPGPVAPEVTRQAVDAYLAREYPALTALMREGAFARTMAALGLDPRAPLPGESPTRVEVWSTVELEPVRARAGGRLTVTPLPGVARTWDVTLTVELPGIGRVTVESSACGGSPGQMAALGRLLAAQGGGSR